MNLKSILRGLVCCFTFYSSAFANGQEATANFSVLAPASDTSAVVKGMKMVKIPAGQTADLGLYVNTTGVVNIIIKTRDGSDEISEMWWINWGFGSITSLGRQKGSFHTPVAVKLWKGIISAKLRARAGASDTVVYLSTSGVAPAAGISFQW